MTGEQEVRVMGGEEHNNQQMKQRSKTNLGDDASSERVRGSSGVA